MKSPGNKLLHVAFCGLQGMVVVAFRIFILKLKNDFAIVNSGIEAGRHRFDQGQL